MQLEEKVRKETEKYAMIPRGGRAVVGVSGGADSVCLLLVLCSLKKELGFELSCVHVHHGLRPSADADADYVRDLCMRLKVPFSCVRIQTAEYAASHHIGTEEAGHILRREIFEDACRKWEEKEPGIPCRIALAHHLEDRAETVLFHLCRGSSLAGLDGISPVSGRIIRPLLSCTREEIETYLKERNVLFCTDETNADISYARNRIRHRVLPELLQVNEKALEHLALAGDDAGRAQAYLEKETERILGLCRRQDKGLDLAMLLSQDPYLQGRILYLALSQAAGRKKDIGRVHVESLLALCRKDGNRDLDLPYGIRARKQYGVLYLGDCEDREEAALPRSREDYSVRIFPFKGGMDAVPAKRYTKWFDYDKIGSFPTFRKRKEGDRITLGEGRRKKVSRIMIDAKIPARARDSCILPAAGEEILWVPGARESSAFRVDLSTKTILELSLEKGESYGRDSHRADQ